MGRLLTLRVGGVSTGDGCGIRRSTRGFALGCRVVERGGVRTAAVAGGRVRRGRNRLESGRDCKHYASINLGEWNTTEVRAIVSAM